VRCKDCDGLGGGYDINTDGEIYGTGICKTCDGTGEVPEDENTNQSS
jgi:DnaJ-class molecular chaperone